MRSLRALLVAVLFVVVVAAATFPEEADAGSSWVPIPARGLSSLVIQQVGRFAVLVHNLTKRTNLVFVDVVRGETERPAGGGTSYRLVVAAKVAPGGRTRQYECVVWGVPGSRSNTWKLLSFKGI